MLIRVYFLGIINWIALYSWYEENNYTIRDYPPFEKYMNSINDGYEKF